MKNKHVDKNLTCGRAWRQGGKAVALRLLRERRPVFWFTALVALGFFVFLTVAAVCGEKVFLGIFHRGATAPFADFFQSVQDAARGRAVYSERRVIYPPLANAVFYLISRVMPADDLIGEAGSFADHPAALLAFGAFLVLSFSLIALLLAAEPHGGLSLPFAFFTAASFPMLFLMERGNLALLSLAALLVFVRGFYSKNTASRELGLFALGVATALKIYPLLFGLVLIKEHKWGEFLRVAWYSFLLFLLPSFFFGGPFFCAGWLIKNTLYYSEYAARGVLLQLGAFGLSAALARAMLYGALAALLLLLLYCIWAGQERYKTWALIAAVLLCIPSVFSAYNWVLFLPALLAFFREERLDSRTVPWFLGVASPFFLYVPKPLQDNGLILLQAVIILLSLIEAICNRKREKHPWRCEKIDFNL